MLTTVRHIFGRIMHSETALCSQWDKGWKNNLLFASPSIRRPTCDLSAFFSADSFPFASKIPSNVPSIVPSSE